MIMKLNVSNELKSRLTHAAENGSVIAKDILSEVKRMYRWKKSYGGPTIFSPPNANGRKPARSRKSESCSRHATKTWAIPISRTGTIRRHPGFRRTGQIWNRPRLSSCSKIWDRTSPMKSTISAAPSHWTARSQSDCMTV